MSISAPAATDKALRMSYRVARGEQGVLSFQPYKSLLLPLWRFRTPSIARQSSAALYDRFEAYDGAGDFVGMDMCRKFIQMGMTRAKRYANHKGGRKYEKGTGRELEKSEGHEGMREKLESSEVFKECWGRCRAHEGYRRRKEEFLGEQKVWDRERKSRKTVEDGAGEGDAQVTEDDPQMSKGQMKQEDSQVTSHGMVKRSRKKQPGEHG